MINPARGSLVHEKAVETAFSNKQIFGYAADTFEVENWSLKDGPGSISSVLLTSERTVFTPYIDSAVREVYEAIEYSATKSLIDGINGRFSENIVIHFSSLLEEASICSVS